MKDFLPGKMWAQKSPTQIGPQLIETGSNNSIGNAYLTVKNLYTKICFYI
jgi:hypothetical protein